MHISHNCSSVWFATLEKPHHHGEKSNTLKKILLNDENFFFLDTYKFFVVCATK